LKTVLYLTYDGLSDPLGQSQILKYLVPLSKTNKLIILSFEKNFKDQKIIEIANLLEKHKIKWYRLKYHKYPKIISSFYDILCFFIFFIFLNFRYKINITHARSYIPTFVAASIKIFCKYKLIFDMRGFWPDERVDGNIWSKKSLIYRITKKIEKYLLLKSDVIITLTKNSIKILKKEFYINEKKIFFIPTCVDLDQFNLQKNNYDKNNFFTLGYHGSVGTWYEFDKVLLFYKEIRKVINNVKLKIISQTDKSIIEKYLKKYNLVINQEEIDYITCNHNEIQNYIKDFDISIFFIKKCFSKIASCPTKFAESLAMGIPVITGPEIGDIDNYILKNDNIGYVIKDFNSKEINNAINYIIKIRDYPKTNQKCYEVAKKYFNLKDGVTSYDNLYKTLV